MSSKKKFVPIIIKSLEQLKAFANVLEDVGTPLWADDIQKLREAANSDSLTNRLKRWLDYYNIEVCVHGEKKMLAAAGKLNSWREYILKHWNDHDGVRDWFGAHDIELFGGSVSQNDHEHPWAALNGPRYLKNITASGGTLPSWPFKRVKKAKKARKSSKRR